MKLPAWADYGLLTLLNLCAALLVSGLVILAVGENPVTALATVVDGVAGDPEGLGYTLYYATTFFFTGLAVAIPFHAGLFNIGGEGQVMIGGLGATLVCLSFGASPSWLVVPLAIAAAMAGGAGWAFVPAWLQARRGSHIVITTIMFNFIAATLLTGLLVGVLIAPGQAAPETKSFSPSTWLPAMHEMLAMIGVRASATPLNASLFLALAAGIAASVLIWHTRWGYELRVIGHSEAAARYGGIAVERVAITALCLGGACAGLAAVNDVMGAEHRLILNSAAGSGFIGIAVALMGRNHPLGIAIAALLFGALYQGGSALAFEMPKLQGGLIVMIEGLVILFCGALENMFRPCLTRLFGARPAAAS